MLKQSSSIISRFCLSFIMVWSLLIQPNLVLAQGLILPPAGDKVALSPSLRPVLLSAITVDPKNPLQLDFYIDEGRADQPASAQDRNAEYLLLVKDFLVALTVPEDQLWVNLSPFEKDRIIDDHFGQTDMGRDLLAQDYLLKQITASLLYPEAGTGKAFWDEVYRRAHAKFGSTDVPVDTFNKVWIMPDTADVYQKGSSALVLNGRLKVMLESDYLALQKQSAPAGTSSGKVVLDERQILAQQVMRDIMVPVLEREVNEGANFARLRQIYHALILAAWYKKTMREGLLGQVYVDRGKMAGIQQLNVADNMKIYDQYVEAFRQGVVNYIKEDIDIYTGEIIPRKYLSGGFIEGNLLQDLHITDQLPADFARQSVTYARVSTAVDPAQTVDSLNAYNVIEGLNGVPRPIANEITGMRKINLKILKLLEDVPISWGDVGVLDTGNFTDAQKELRKDPAIKQLIKEMKVLRQKAKKGFQLFLKGEHNDIAEPLIETFNAIVDDPVDSDIQKLILTGQYTINVYQIMSAIGSLSREKNNVDFRQILDILGLDKSLQDSFTVSISSLNEVADYKDFSKMIESTMVLVQDINNPLFLHKSEDDRQILENLRAQRYKKDYNELNDPVSQEALQAHKLLRLAFQNISSMIRSMGFSETTVKEIASFARSKVESSIRANISKDKDKSSLEKFHDLLACRIVLPKEATYRDLARAYRSLMKSRTQLSKFQEEMRKRIKSIEYALKNMNLKEHKRTNLIEELGQLNEDLQNFTFTPNKLAKNQYHRRVLVRNINYFDFLMPNNERKSTPDWYRAVHDLDALGYKDYEMEIQIKMLDQSILQALEHKVFFKSKGKEKVSYYPSLMKLIWLSNAVQAAKYVQSVDPKIIPETVDQYLKDKGVDRAQQGGIDVRNIEDSLRLKTDNGDPLIEFKKSDLALENLTGFTPRIIAIQAVKGLAFLTSSP